MNMVKQIGISDCFLACIAMIVNKQILEIFPNEFFDHIQEVKGCNDEEIDKAFSYGGLIKDENYTHIYIPINLYSDRHLRAMLYGRRAILQVPSLNIEKSSHVIVWDGKNILDPSTKQIYRWINSLQIEGIWLINENWRAE